MSEEISPSTVESIKQAATVAEANKDLIVQGLLTSVLSIIHLPRPVQMAAFQMLLDLSVKSIERIKSQDN
jgi:hypothetical protein